MTVLDELLPYVLDMAKKDTTGTINLTNPGLVSHNEILEMYKKHIDNDFTWKNFTIEEQNLILLSMRSNIQLSNDKLYNLYPNIPDIKTSVENCIKTYHNKS